MLLNFYSLAPSHLSPYLRETSLTLFLCLSVSPLLPPTTRTKTEKQPFWLLLGVFFYEGASGWGYVHVGGREGKREKGFGTLFFKTASCFCPVFCLLSLRLLCSQVPPRQGRGKGKKLQWTFSFLRQRGMYTTQQSCTTVLGQKWIAAFVPFVTDGTHKSPISESRKGGEEEERAMGRGEEDACLKRYYYTTYIPPPNKTLKGWAN